jgi:lysophospholipase L1-like esterase
VGFVVAAEEGGARPEGAPAIGSDFFVTDALGVLKNAPDANDTVERISKARARGDKIVVLYGGSTMMGIGSRAPNFTIASLVEKILEQDHGIRAVCINRGIAGAYCQDALNVMMAELHNDQPDCVVFYDGWNCCHHLLLNKVFRDVGPFEGEIPVYRGMSLRHLEHDIVLHRHFDIKQVFRHGWRLAGTSLLTGITRMIPSQAVRRSCAILAERFFSLKNNIYFNASALRQSADSEVLARESAEDYWRIHHYSKAICDVAGVKFVTYFQPVAWWGGKPFSITEQAYIEASRSVEDDHVHFYREVSRHRDQEWFVDLSDTFKNASNEVYIDSGHLNRLGNVFIARAMAADLAVRLGADRLNES